MTAERLQKILARAGVASRRKAEQYILEGRVRVNGKTVTELGTKADPERDHIKVDGKLLHLRERPVYLMLNKPKGCVTTASDPQGRPTVMDYLKGVRGRVYPVGRLDYQSEGLLLVTNDGDFAARILGPSHHVPKTYEVKVNGPLTPDEQERFREGIPLHGRRTAPAGLKLLKPARNPWYEVTLIEGRQNQIRIMFRHFGRLVEKLRRTKIGPLSLGALKPGEFRPLTETEVARFRRLLGLDSTKRST